VPRIRPAAPIRVARRDGSNLGASSGPAFAPVGDGAFLRGLATGRRPVPVGDSCPGWTGPRGGLRPLPDLVHSRWPNRDDLFLLRRSVRRAARALSPALDGRPRPAAAGPRRVTARRRPAAVLSVSGRPNPRGR